jgi:hypothetical protein
MVLLDGGKALFPVVYAEDIADFVLHVLSERHLPEPVNLFVIASPARTVMRDVFNCVASLSWCRSASSAPSVLALTQSKTS